MRRFTTVVILFTLFFLSCQAVALPLTGFPNGPQPWRSTQETSTVTLLGTLTASPSPKEQVLPPINDTPTPSPSPSLTPTPTTVTEEGFDVRFHPDGGLYVGDRVSLEVIAPPAADVKDKEVRVQIGTPDEWELELAKFGPYGIAGRQQATMTWAWDTSGLEPGSYNLSFSIEPGGPTWRESVTLQPAEQVPPPEPGAQWAFTETDCCLIYYITGTAADRDLAELETMAEEQAQNAVHKLDTGFEDAIPIVFLPRVLGHGGFANDTISVSYLDRNYAGSSPEFVLHHEMIHILDGRLGGELRPTLLVEGLAVYLTGGHFKPEALMPRSAALLATGRYLPLIQLADEFYPAQHETGYLEGASLIEYMVETWGWDAFSDFYRDIHPAPDKIQSKAIDAALQKHYGLSFAELEDRFVEALRTIPVTPELQDDVRLTLDYYDTVRRYQQALDPSAYFMTAWLPNSKEMRERGIVADYLRNPSSTENVALETLLVAADSHLRLADYERTDELLQAVNAVLDEIEVDSTNPFSARPLAASYYDIVQTLTANGYTPQILEVNGDTAQAWVTTTGPALQELILERRDDRWAIKGQAHKKLKGGVQ
jgi:hypothetical protein